MSMKVPANNNEGLRLHPSGDTAEYNQHQHPGISSNQSSTYGLPYRRRLGRLRWRFVTSQVLVV